MSEEIPGRLRRLHQYATDLQAMVESVQSQAPPDSVTASDPSGVVSVTIGEDGLPAVIRVEAGWQRRITPEELGPSVVAAFLEAVAEGTRLWSEAFDVSSWESRVEEAQAEADHRRRGGEVPSLPQVDVYGTPRDPVALTEEVLNALKAVRVQAGEPTPTYTGRAGDRAVALTLTAGGLQACDINPRWASSQSAAPINSGLAEALRSARAALEAHAVQRRAEAQGVDDLAREALATLAQMHDLTEQPKDR